MKIIDIRIQNIDTEMTAWKERWPNFSPFEIACRESGRIVMPEEFFDELQKLRTHLGRPMHVTSGCRSVAHNLVIGGKSRSFHLIDANERAGVNLGCIAVDVAAVDGPYRGALFAAAWIRGWTIGWNAARGFLHLDRRDFAGWRQTSFDY